MGERTVSLNEKPLGYTEALATWTVRYQDPSGYVCELSLEAETGSEVLSKAEAAITHLTKLKCVPIFSGNQNGNGQGEASQYTSKTIQKVEGEKKICPIHGVPMGCWQKGNKTWHAHRMPEGWCQGGAK